VAAGTWLVLTKHAERSARFAMVDLSALMADRNTFAKNAEVSRCAYTTDREANAKNALHNKTNVLRSRFL